MHHPLVSIIIPTRNRPETVKRAITSALEQTYTNIEVIVIDDASEKQSLQELKKQHIPGLVILENETHRGGPFSRNRGLKTCKGEYVVFLDDDDQLFPKKVELQVAKFQSQSDESVGVITSHAEDYRSGEKKIKYNRLQGNIYAQALNSYAVHGIETMMIKKSLLEQTGGFDPDLLANQEYDLMVRLSRYSNFDYVDEILSRENRSDTQINRNYKRKVKATAQLIARHHPFWVERGLKTVMYNYIRYLYLIIRYVIGAVFGEKIYRYFER